MTQYFFSAELFSDTRLGQVNQAAQFTKSIKMKCFMQNKPNLRIAQMNTTSFLTNSYENIPLRSHPQNKPNQTQFKPKTKPICRNAQTNANLVLTKDYGNVPLRTMQKQSQNKPNPNPFFILCSEFTLSLPKGSSYFKSPRRFRPNTTGLTNIYGGQPKTNHFCAENNTIRSKKTKKEKRTKVYTSEKENQHPQKAHGQYKQKRETIPQNQKNACLQNTKLTR